MHYYHVARGGRIKFQIQRSMGHSVATAMSFS